MNATSKRRTTNDWTRLSLVMLGAIGGSVAIFATTREPFLWTFLLWGASALVGALISRSTIARATLVNIATVLVVLGVFEGYLWLRELWNDPTRMEGSYTTEYFVPDEVLGYGPHKGVVVTSEKYHGAQPIYRVRYTISPDGLRVSPPSQEGEGGCVLFFGGSVTFGEGVPDDQAMPYQVGVLTAGHYPIYNFAFHGYGPHQMLAALQAGRVDQIIHCRPSHVIYQGILSHVERVAGLTIWDQHGPRYVIAPGGGVTLAGHFDDEQTANPWKGWLNRWLTYDTLFGRRRPAGPHEIALYAEILAEARAFVEGHYPGAQFDVLLWDNRRLPTQDQIIKALQAKGLRLHPISEILPDYYTDEGRYQLSSFDHHPTAEAHGLIARYVAEHILGYREAHGITPPR